MARSYVQPEVLAKWVRDVAGGDLYECFVLGDGTVCAASGRSGHSSSAGVCTWREFLDGKYNQAVEAQHGLEVLLAARARIEQAIAGEKRVWWKFWT